MLIVFILTPSAWAGSAKISACLKQVTPLKAQVEEVADLDGIWGLFQKQATLRDNSVQSITLDKDINSIIFHLSYLCDTIDGLPLDELADYVLTGLAEKGENKFKEEQIVLGKSEGEIAVWLKFAKFASAHQHRNLDLQRIFKTIHSALPLTSTYLALARKISREEDIGSVLEETQNLTDQIETFFETDPYMSQAIHENSQIPYADWDENYGGS